METLYKAKTIAEMDREADKLILKWAAGGMLTNLAPPPFDFIGIMAAMTKLGYDVAKIYDIECEEKTFKKLAWIIFKGVGAVNTAAKIGTSLFYYVPGVNLANALLIQPPLVFALTFTAGKSYKKYFSTIKATGKEPEDSEIKKTAKKIYKEESEKAIKKIREKIKDKDELKELDKLLYRIQNGDIQKKFKDKIKDIMKW